MKDTYIAAVLQMINDGKDSSMVFCGLQKTLKERGHERLYTSVLQGVLRVLEAHSSTTTSVVVKDEAGAKENEVAIKAALTQLGSDNDPVITTDETLIGGFVVEHNSQRIDQSYKTKLVTLYRSLTS